MVHRRKGKTVWKRCEIQPAPASARPKSFSYHRSNNNPSTVPQQQHQQYRSQNQHSRGAEPSSISSRQPLVREPPPAPGRLGERRTTVSSEGAVAPYRPGGGYGSSNGSGNGTLTFVNSQWRRRWSADVEVAPDLGGGPVADVFYPQEQYVYAPGADLYNSGTIYDYRTNTVYTPADLYNGDVDYSENDAAEYGDDDVDAVADDVAGSDVEASSDDYQSEDVVIGPADEVTLLHEGEEEDDEMAPTGNNTRRISKRNNGASTPSSSAANVATSTGYLSERQVDRLRSVLAERVEIHGRGNFPTICVRLLDLILCVRAKLCSYGVAPKQVKMNGGAASYVVAADEFAYADLDLIFPINFEADDTFDMVRTAIFSAIVDLMPDETDKSRISADTLKDVYIRKMVKVDDADRWSLFSLHNNYGRCIELKFVDRMRRQFEFSVDSFQIKLDDLLDNFDCPDTKVVIESVFGDIRLALEHLDQRLIDTQRPEEIRGGGLLKYCHLLVRGYKAADPDTCKHLERYMCSRFFIDFPDVHLQESKLRNYLDSHFSHNSSLFDSWSSSSDETDSEASTSQASSHPSMLSVQQSRYDFLMHLYNVISESTVCLMNHERRQTLLMVDRLAYQISMNFYHWRDRHDLTGAHVTVGGGHRQTLLYLCKDTDQWIPVPVI